MLGKGSNTVVSDYGFEGLVLHLSGDFRRITIDPTGIAEAGSAATLPQLARAPAPFGLGGIEFFVGIPGTVGGAVAMNAGFFGTETRDVLIDARVLNVGTGEWATMTNSDLGFSYRQSAITRDNLVASARFRLEPVDGVISLEKMREITRWRKERQPGGTHNAGSVFKNPPDGAAGQIIDELGLKGFSVNDATVSDRHANFFVAGPQASAQECLRPCSRGATTGF